MESIRPGSVYHNLQVDTRTACELHQREVISQYFRDICKIVLPMDVRVVKITHYQYVLCLSSLCGIQHQAQLLNVFLCAVQRLVANSY